MNGQMTELEAVNEVLATVGDTPVQTLLPGTYIEALRILQILKETSREIQSRGWWFNEEENKTLQPDINGLITLGFNVIEVSVTNDYDGSIIQRGNRLFNRDTGTYNINKEVKVNLIVGLEWNELPQVARLYITSMTAFKYNSGYVGLTEVKQDVQAILGERYVQMKISDTRSRDVNIFDNYTNYNISRRNRR
jgi:hypothetical protein